MNNKAEIFNELKELSVFLLQLKEKEVLPEAPAGYFESLNNVVVQKVNVVDELKSISSLVARVKMNEEKPEVPVNYFDQFKENILSISKMENEPFIAVSKDVKVPDGYFDSLADTVLAKIKAQEETIREGTLRPQRKTKVVELFARIAIAASLVGIIIFGVKNFHKAITPVNNCEDGIACLTRDEIYNYMNVHSHEFDVQQIQEAVRPEIEKTEATPGIEKKEAVQYIEQHKNVLDVEDASTDIF